MLPLPDRRIRESSTVHNSQLSVAGDWLELNCLVQHSDFSRADVLDELMEQQIYKDQSFGSEFVSSIWSELRQRQRWLGASADLAFTDTGTRAVDDWKRL